MPNSYTLPYPTSQDPGVAYPRRSQAPEYCHLVTVLNSISSFPMTYCLTAPQAVAFQKAYVARAYLRAFTIPDWVNQDSLLHRVWNLCLETRS